MTNEAKIIKNVILSYPQAEVKDIIINCIYTIIGAVNHLSVPNLKGVPLDIFRLVPQGEGVLRTKREGTRQALTVTSSR